MIAHQPGYLPMLDADAVAALLPYDEIVDEMEREHRRAPAISGRTVLGSPDSDESFLALSAWQPGEAVGAKLVSVFPANADRPSVQAVFVLFDGATGSALAVLDGTELTYRKTAADSALGARYLARSHAETLLMVGAGGLSPHLVAAHTAVRPSIDRVLVWNRTTGRAEAVAERLRDETNRQIDTVTDLEEAVGQADIVCTATMAAEPLVAGRWVRPGTHLDLVGSFRPDHREVDDDAVAVADLYVDDRHATLTEDGDLVIPLTAGLITPQHIRGDLWELCRGDVAGRTDDDTITLFKNGGGAHLDLMTARLAWSRAG